MLRDDRDSGGGPRRRTSRNVLGEPLEPCSIKPMAGFYRDGCCNTGAEDFGSHTVCVVMNNGCWGAEKAYQRDFFGGRYLGADVPNPPYDKLAELFGAAGFRVERAQDIERVLSAALACNRPAVVDIQVDPNALFSFRRDSFAHRSNAR